MRTTFLLSGIALSVSLVAGGVTLAPAFAQTAKFTSGLKVRPGISIPQIQEKLASLGYRNIERIKRDRNAFEVKASDKNGGRVKLYVDAQTGEIIDQRTEGHRGDQRAQRDIGEGRRDSADCSKRRCRDDQPQQDAAAPLAGR